MPRSASVATVAACLLFATGPHAWAAPAGDERVEKILAQMTLDEKLELLGGVDGFFVRGVPRLGVPRLKMADGPLGVRNFGPATAMAGGIALAATWDPALAERVGREIGRDARAKGVHFLLGPGVNIYRAPMNGRNFEYMGEDPFLAARTAAAYIKGVQSQGVSATVKHFMGNNSEFDRHQTDSIIDERTMREIYLPVFEAAVKDAHVGAIMDSYNLTNGQHLTESVHLNQEIAKKEWGFDGVMMSDWDATYDTVAAANAGLDLEMPSGKFLNPTKLKPALEQKQVALATIDDKVRRILGLAARFGWLDRDQTDLTIPRLNPDGRQAALQGAREAMVLLKNEGGVLPFDANVKTIAVIGPDAYPAVPIGGGSAGVAPWSATSILESVSRRFANAKVFYARGVPSLREMADATEFTTEAANGKRGLVAEYFANDTLDGAATVTRPEWHVSLGRDSFLQFPAGTSSSRWTGYYVPGAAGEHDIFVAGTGEDGGAYRLSIDGKVILDSWKENRAMAGEATLTLDATPHKIVLEQHGRSFWLGGAFHFGIVRRGTAVSAEAKALAQKADAVVLAVGFAPDTESEGSDRTFRLPPGQDELVREIAAANKKTVVVVTSGGAVDMSAWVDQVPGLIEAWYPGQEGGPALAEIVSGDVNPSGHLPASFERRWEDNPAHDSYYPQPGTKRVEYKEGVFVGYRGYEHNGTKPLFPFGYGLSYTTFGYANASVAPAAGGTGYDVSFDVTNTGTCAGADVAQIYVADTHAKVPRPGKELKGFARVELAPGEKKRVVVTLDDRAFAYYDATGKKWQATAGAYDVLIGRSSAEATLKTTVTYKPAAR